MKLRLLPLLFCFVVTVVGVQQSVAQSQITVPYSMGFEESDSVELGNWVLNCLFLKLVDSFSSIFLH